MKLAKKPSSSSKEDKKYPPGSFIHKLRERKIFETLAGFVGGGVILVEFAHHILVNHYRLPHQIVDVCLVTVTGALVMTLIWRWFRGAKEPRKIKIEVILVPLIFLIAGFLDAMLLVQMVKPKAREISEVEWENSIAVLPFENLSPDIEQEYFCDGLTEEIINSLTSIDELKVVARTSVFSFKGKQNDIRTIGNELNVKTVLEGSVRKAGNQLRITAQLINVADGYHIWSERFERELDDVFAIQDEISLAIADKLKLSLLGEEKPQLIKHETEDVEAYNLYLRGRFFSSSKTEEGLKKAIEFFEKAIKEDPDYALAYIEMADIYLILPVYSSFPTSKAYAKAKEMVQKALTIDSTLAEAHATMASIKAYEFDWKGAEREFLRAIDLNPGNAHAHHMYGYNLAHTGRFDEALDEMKRALELDPFSLAIRRNIGRVHYLAGRYDQAFKPLQETIEMNPNFTYAHMTLALIYLKKSMYAEALTEIQKEKTLQGADKVLLDAVSGVIYAQMGNQEEAQQVLDDILKRSKTLPVSSYWLAVLFFTLGEKDQGFEWLDRAYEERDFWLRELKVEPLLEGVRSDPRFRALLRKIGFN